MKCGKGLSEDAEYCRDCSTRRHYFKRGLSLFDYGSVSDSLFRFKNKGRKEYSEFYAREMLKKHGQFLKSIHPDAFIPVPIHPSKMRKRGYNQAELISRQLTAYTNIPTNTTLVKRVKNTIPLKNLGLKERQKNLNRAFKIGSDDVKLKTIVIIDDIYTTGSTIDEISKVISEKFPCEIYFMTLTVGRG